VPDRAATETSSGRRSGRDTASLIHRAAVLTIAELGVDGAALPRVAERAGLSIGPLYSRFDNTDDLLSAVWSTELRDHFSTLTDAVSRWINGAPTDPNGLLITEMSEPSATTAATLEALAAARRYPYAGDQIRSDAAAAYASFLGSVAPVPPVLAGYSLASILGSMLLHPVLAPTARTRTADLLDIIRSLTEPRPVEDVQTDLTFPMPMPVISSGATIPDTFLNATLDVIARGGFEHASTSRIARAAGLPASRVYAHFESKHQLAAQALGSIIDRIVGAAALAFVGADRGTYQQMVIASGRGLCDPGSLAVRRLRLECLLAARHHHDIEETARDGFDRAEHAVVDLVHRFAPTGGHEMVHSAQTMWHLVRNFGFGVIVLDEAASVLGPDLDLLPLAMSMPQLYHEYIAGPVGIEI
jgi:AcrR family transcriptional regulator